MDRFWEYINRSLPHECECGNETEAAQFPEKENIIGIFVAVCYSSAVGMLRRGLPSPHEYKMQLLFSSFQTFSSLLTNIIGQFEITNI